ncbi:DUF5337 domain-containing protein [Marivivens sp. LCG002]|uniref:DUF5337 domain-containing protein n=1 Tax=Marivivens sp. LCG002 TaxID=3051171 RepID=UPI00255213BC|nr:DUF5337 domain-containing protein [Marivivens sp. LCG002]WIV51703.1 DUF5337 domain-containing protein [Marivivens sp. LCG002]
MVAPKHEKEQKTGQRIALAIAVVALIWVGATFAGEKLGWSNRTMALFDLIALAGFGWALWMTYGIWRARQNDKG